MTQPFFSICIAAYNAQHYIGDCLGSIAAQDCRDFEVLIVDDGSMEPLALDEDVRSFLPSCTLRRTANGGPYAARQVAFDIANGEVILCIDADDGLRDPAALSKIKSAFGDGADVVLFNASSSEHEPTRMFDFSLLGEGGPVEENLVWDLYTKGYSLNSLWCKAFKRTLYSKGENARPRLLMAEDRLQSLEIMSGAKSYWLIDEPLYFYRPNPLSTTNANYDPGYYEQVCYVEDEVVSCMHDRKIPLKSWANYFLTYTSSALLGIRYNRGLTAPVRRAAYASVREQKILGVAMESFPMSSLSRIDAMRLSLLKEGRFAALDLSMLPWRVGSGAKRLVNTLRRACKTD